MTEGREFTILVWNLSGGQLFDKSSIIRNEEILGAAGQIEEGNCVNGDILDQYSRISFTTLGSVGGTEFLLRARGHVHVRGLSGDTEGCAQRANRGELLIML